MKNKGDIISGKGVLEFKLAFRWGKKERWTILEEGC